MKTVLKYQSLGWVAFLVGVWVLTGVVERNTARKVREASAPVQAIPTIQFTLKWGYTVETLRRDVAPFVGASIWEKDFLKVNRDRHNPIDTDKEGRVLNLMVYLPLYANFNELKSDGAKVALTE